MDCEFCLNKAVDVTATDWGFRHTCAECAGSIITPLKEERDTEECFNTVAKRYVKELLQLPERPPNKPK